MAAKCSLSFIFLLITLFVHAQLSFTNYALTHLTIIDANHKAGLPHQTLVICNGIITDMFEDGSHTIADSVIKINLNGKYALPGLVDAHVHLATDPSGIDNREHTLNTLKRMLCSGVTTVRDMAGDARTLASLSRDAASGDIISPNIYYSALMAGLEFFNDPRTEASSSGAVPGTLPFMRAVTDTITMAIAIAEARGTGASGLKLYADLSAPLVQKIVAEAQKQHILVWAHAWVQKATPHDLVKAGVNVISHAPLLIHESQDTIPLTWKKEPHDSVFWNKVTPDISHLLALMKERRTILDATLLTYKQWADDDSTMQYDYELAKRFTAAAYKAGVDIDAGTDVDQKDFVQKEMELLVKDAGFSASDAIVAATLTGAKALRLDDKQGTLAAGKKADILIVNENPLSNINNVEAVFLVVKDGKLYKK